MTVEENASRSTSPTIEDRYLDLLKQVLTRMLFIDEEVWDIGQPYQGWVPTPGARAWTQSRIRALLARRGLRLVRTGGDRALRRAGRDWPPTAETMIGVSRLDSVQKCIERVLAENIKGDLIETGAWRGGCSIFMRAVLLARGDTKRTVWVADSFEGLAPPDYDAHPNEFEIDLSVFDLLAVSVDEVKSNFSRYDLLDGQVRFLPGWFKDTLPDAPVDKLALLRLDGDYYESTMTALTHLYPKVSSGGFIIVDDYIIPACGKAVTEFRASVGDESEIVHIDVDAVYWRKP